MSAEKPEVMTRGSYSEIITYFEVKSPFFPNVYKVFSDLHLMWSEKNGFRRKSKTDNH
jgi:hypothetical protein